MKTTRRTLGVDLGTTWTAAAVDGEVLTLANHGAAMPSVVAVDGGTIVVGEVAERRLLADPTCGVREMKRRLGDTTPMVLGGTPYGAEALMGHLLAHVVAVATERHGAAPDCVTLTHPANWGAYKLDLLHEAARVAGVDSVELISEPQAAALHYVQLGRLHDGDAVAVYDFGGGTFDAAVVRCTAGGAELLGQAEGLERLGGIDIDQVVVAHVNAALDGQLAELDSSDPEVRRALARLRSDCTGAKEALSADGEVAIAVMVPSIATSVRLTRTELESALRPRLADTLAALDRAVRSAGLSFEQLAGVVLVGGSSRIPLVAEEVARHTGRPVLVDADPKLVVCMGATQRDQIVPASGDAVPVAAAPEAGEASPTPPTSPAAGAGPSAAAGPATRVAANTAQAADAQRQRSKTASTVGAVAAGVAATAGLVAGGLAVSGVIGGDDDESDSGWGGLFGDEDDSLDAFEADATEEPEMQGLMGALPDTPITAVLDEPAVSFAPPPAPAPAPQPEAAAPQFRSAPPRPQAAEPDPVRHEPARPRPAPEPEAVAPIGNGELDEVKGTLAQRLGSWTPPEGADPAEVAELRAELAALIDRHQVVPGQSVEQAIEALQDEFGQRVQDFVQDTKLDALIEDRQQGIPTDEPPTDPAAGEPEMPADPTTDTDTDTDTDDMAEDAVAPATTGTGLVDEFDEMMAAEESPAQSPASESPGAADASSEEAPMPASEMAGIAIGESDPTRSVSDEATTTVMVDTFDDVLGDRTFEADLGDTAAEMPVGDMAPDPRVTMPAFDELGEPIADEFHIEVEPPAEPELHEIDAPSYETTWVDDDEPAIDDIAPLDDPNTP